jgi:steroid 5-alpha reductase family enzyme
VPLSVAHGLWPALVGALAAAYAALGPGAWTRRSAIAWMMGSWGARLAVQAMYTRAAIAADVTTAPSGRENMPTDSPMGESIGIESAERRAGPLDLARLVSTAVLCSLPALLACFNRAPELSPMELAACALWLFGFAGETTADRQRLRFASNAANRGLACRTGLWRYSIRVNRLFSGVVWLAFVLFGLAAIVRRFP